MVFLIRSQIGAAEPDLTETLLTHILQEASIDDGKVRVALVTFDMNTNREFSLNTYSNREAIISAIGAVQYQTGTTTNIALGLWAVRQVFVEAAGDRPDVPNVAILITDSASNAMSSMTITMADGIKAGGTHIFVIGVQDADVVEIEAIASAPSSLNCMKGQHLSELQRMKDYVFRTMCTGKSHLCLADSNICSSGNCIFLRQGS